MSKTTNGAMEQIGIEETGDNGSSVNLADLVARGLKGTALEPEEWKTKEHPSDSTRPWEDESTELDNAENYLSLIHI